MRIRAIWIIAIASCLGACGQQEATEPEQPEVDRAVEESVPAKPVASQAFLDHMHAHAEQLDELMFALADGDLEGAMTPAYWLSRHDTVDALAPELQPYSAGMREAALAVEAANDLETAQSAAEELSAQCQACHTAAGVNTL